MSRVAVGRAALFFALWLMIAGYRAADLPIGLATAALATWASLRLLPASRLHLRWWPLASFVAHFLAQSVSAGVQVARLALSPSMKLRPGFVVYRPGLQSASARNAFCAVSSLLPGTLPAGSDGDDALLVHCLDVDQPVAASFAAEEARFRRMIGDD
jgi:multicomponent Na+:H+ antiporter subunit E